jgi:O-succinylbenzoate synthase
MVEVPFRRPWQGLTHRRAVIVEGPAGFGEMSPLPGFPSDPDRCRRSAEEAAFTGWLPPVRRQVAVNAVIGAVPPAEAAARATEAVSRGMGTVKVKVGDADDIDRVAQIRNAVGPGTRLRVDANGAWDLDTAVDRLGALRRYDLELAEQPVASLADLARLRRRTDIRLAADECVRSLDDARRLAALEAADVLVVKVQPLGGVRAALAVVEAAGVPAIVTSMLETSVGLAAGLALAAALPELPFACGLATATLLAADITDDPLVAHDGVLELRPVRPSRELMARYALSSGSR